MRSASVTMAGPISAAGNPKLPVRPVKYTFLNDVRLTAASQITKLSPSGGANSVVVTADTTAPVPGGQLAHVRMSNVGYNGSTLAIPLGTPWDMTNSFFRYHVRTDYTNMRGGFQWRFAANAAGYAAGNYWTYKVAAGNAQPNFLTRNVFCYDSAHPAVWTPTGTPPALNSIGYLVLNLLDVNVSIQNYWDFSRIQNVQIAAGAKAKCVIWHDDSVPAGADAIWSKLAAYGWAATEATEWEMVAVDNSNFQYQKYLAAGWQLGSHATTGAEHGTATAEGVANQAYRNKIADTRYRANKGSSDFAYWGGLDAFIAYPVLQKAYRSGRFNTSGLAYPDTQPPGDAHMMKSWLVNVSETAVNWETILTNAIASKGIASFTFHQDVASNPTVASEFDKLLVWLDANRASIDVVTIDQALAASVA